jgi:hypothetical protein
MSFKLIAIGHWSDTLFSDTDSYIDPSYLVDKANYNERERKAIVEYLRNGMKFCSWLGYSYDRLRPNINGPYMGDSDLTDGVWSWPEGLKHYVEHYNILLPEKFLDYLRSNSFYFSKSDVRDKIDNKTLDIDSEDLTFWNNWCSKIKRTEEVQKTLPRLEYRISFPALSYKVLTAMPELEDLLCVINKDVELWFYLRHWFTYLLGEDGHENLYYKNSPWLVNDETMQLIWQEITNPKNESLLIKRIQSNNPAGTWFPDVYNAAILQLQERKSPLPMTG